MIDIRFIMVKGLKDAKKESLSLDDFTRKFYQMFKEELTLILHYLFQKTEMKEMLPNSFSEVRNSLIPKPDKDNQRKL